MHAHTFLRCGFLFGPLCFFFFACVGLWPHVGVTNLALAFRFRFFLAPQQEHQLSVDLFQTVHRSQTQVKVGVCGWQFGINEANAQNVVIQIFSEIQIEKFSPGVDHLW